MQMKRFASLTTHIRVRTIFQTARLRVRLREYWSAMSSARGIKVRKKNEKRILAVFSENERRKRDRASRSCVFRSLQTITCNRDGGVCLIYPTREHVATDSLRSQRREKLGRCIDSLDASLESHVRCFTRARHRDALAKDRWTSFRGTSINLFAPRQVKRNLSYEHVGQFEMVRVRETIVKRSEKNNSSWSRP